MLRVEIVCAAKISLRFFNVYKYRLYTSFDKNMPNDAYGALNEKKNIHFLAIHAKRTLGGLLNS